jgi:hypothetical protein
MAGVTKVVFQGSPAPDDDTEATVKPGSARSVKLLVPAGAQTGPLVAVATDTLVSPPTKPLPIMPPPPPKAQAQLTPVPGPRDAGAPQLETGTSKPRFFFGELGGIAFSYRVTDSAPVSVQVDLLRLSDGALVQSWAPGPAQPGQVQTIAWDGLAAGLPAPEGRYAFRAVAQSASGAKARSAQATDPQRDAFDLSANMFPVRGRHDYGGSGGRFGAGRGGRAHQGQDVFARCGTPLVAARAGVVKFKQYHALAGNYLVIDADATEVDYMYAHLAQPSPFRAGDHVATGQPIGAVGDTGNARGCHLHTELWGPPGWYRGGKAFDPLPHLQAWDQVS